MLLMLIFIVHLDIFSDVALQPREFIFLHTKILIKCQEKRTGNTG